MVKKLSSSQEKIRSSRNHKNDSSIEKLKKSPVCFSHYSLQAGESCSRGVLPSNLWHYRFFLKFTVFSTLAIILNLSTSSIVKAQHQNQVKGSMPLPSQPSLVSTSKGLFSYGTQISLNGRTVPGTWLQPKGKATTTYLSDGALRQLIGVDLLNSNNPQLQPVQWFSSLSKPQALNGFLVQGYRYLDVTKFAQQAKWQVQTKGNTLVISTPSAKIANIYQDQNQVQNQNQNQNSPTQQRVIIDLERPTPWKLNPGALIKKPEPLLPIPSKPQLPENQDSQNVVIETNNSTVKPEPPAREWTITIDGVADTNLVQRYSTPPLENILDKIPLPFSLQPTPEPLIRQVEVVNNQTIIRLAVPFGFAPRISTLPAPYRLAIDIRPDALVERSIDWATGLRWKQQFVSLDQERFPVVWLEINPRTSKVKIRPVATNQDKQEGTAPLINTAQKYLAAAAINGGFFNRKNRLPLGAIRRDGQWLSGPILNRGAVAWNDAGQFYMDRLSLQETLLVPNNQSLSISHLNSGYVQQGIARYTHLWGTTYTPLTDNEIIAIVENNQVTQQYAGKQAGVGAVPIPKNGYLIAFRGSAVNDAAKLPITTPIGIVSSAVSPEFNRYPQILGAGPLLVKDNQIVLDAEAEKFGKAFAEQKAIRSAICTTKSGNIILAAVHDRAGGTGPSLTEHAQLMQKLGCVNALNLDGGSSTSLYLGGQLLDRSPNTAASVHNGIGIFLPRP
ncbi:phosphodiester glycosidase family protein [Plectonema cf. radiosum LEGE 06105]|uniref:Phosphodiester glycosidase family protein n=1 Tax=Plectonema cf. radiosum LEGE 06105 TaxID=945769 RepID=A0A8J7FML3_9CYAN|nr:phosphodiester glycosidase family protein [Plectonema radiosum]MBE9216161.1 phosphodiester glycosidase family protein [Plectonema cf. radiosum LEGE 06105]